MNDSLPKKTVRAGLKAIPFVGHAVAMLDAVNLIDSSSGNMAWKSLQTGATMFGTGSILGGFYLSGFHHPAAAAAAFATGVGFHLLAGAAEFAPKKIQGAFVRAMGHGLDHLLPVREIDSR